MIRREVSTSSEWILISQIDHAHLSGMLAERWGAGGVAPLVDRDELLWAIDHHDDGWRPWEQSPDAEQSGRPRAFTEMELVDSLEIWGRSITLAADHGPLAGYVVAGHFCALLRRFGEHRRNDEQLVADAERFLATYETLMDACFRAWQARSPVDRTLKRAQRALAQLQLFDRLSLWFCCDQASEPEEFETPAGPVITLTPLVQSALGGPLGVSLSPWPFTVERLNLEIPGRAIPARRYHGRADLAAAPAQTVLLRWQLRPKVEKV